MNLVRLGMIVTLGAVAWYALSIYAGLPADQVVTETKTVQQNVTFTCPTVSNWTSGIGVVLIALSAIGGAITVAAVDLSRRVY